MIPAGQIGWNLSRCDGHADATNAMTQHCKGVTKRYPLSPSNVDGANVGTVLGRDGELWFVAADVCAALTIGNSRDAVARLDDDEKGVHSIDTLGGRQEVATVTEGGMCSLVLRSRKPEAKRFKRWVTHEVLPSIRKTGGYGAPTIDPMVALNDPATMRTLLLGYTEKVLAMQSPPTL